MSYQVLARKWRPKSFQNLVGQTHVVRALSHALSDGRLHHAYLFTGTRGVGKTTIARILAKSLNCETGISATPCGVCQTCLAIDTGRFVDLFEIDAATNTGIDDMRQLLDNAVYAPTSGRFKVYVIDEVHMLSKSAFNSMLKTLEEPPEHVKFILATTDPQKIPVTVLSRCLQFNLKQMTPQEIAGHLVNVLETEQIPAEIPALNLIAHSAEGSMRDALSLLDQAISHGQGAIKEAEVRQMLGAVDLDYIFELLTALNNNDLAKMLEIAENMQTRSLSFETALQELARLFTQIQVAQLAENAISEDSPNRAKIIEFAQAFSPEYVQLAYQIAIHGRRDLGLAPDEFSGFAMSLMRLLAFYPADQAKNASVSNVSSEAVKIAAKPLINTASLANSRVLSTATLEAKKPIETVNKEALKVMEIPVKSALENAKNDEKSLETLLIADPKIATEIATEFATETLAFTLENWHAMLPKLKLTGLAKQLADHCELRAIAQSNMDFRVDPTKKSLFENASAKEQIKSAIAAHFGKPMQVTFHLETIENETPAMIIKEEIEEQNAAALLSIKNDAFVKSLQSQFDANLIEASIKPI